MNICSICAGQDGIHQITLSMISAASDTIFRGRLKVTNGQHQYLCAICFVEFDKLQAAASAHKALMERISERNEGEQIESAPMKEKEVPHRVELHTSYDVITDGDDLPSDDDAVDLEVSNVRTSLDDDEPVSNRPEVNSSIHAEDDSQRAATHDIGSVTFSTAVLDMDEVADGKTVTEEEALQHIDAELEGLLDAVESTMVVDVDACFDVEEAESSTEFPSLTLNKDMFVRTYSNEERSERDGSDGSETSEQDCSFRCDNCSNTFIKPTMLQEHHLLCKSLEEKLLKCEFCFRLFKYESECLRHIVRLHYPLKWYPDKTEVFKNQCRYCGINLTSENPNHIDKCERKRKEEDERSTVFWCHPCGNPFRTFEAFYYHKQECSESERLVDKMNCDLCYREFITRVGFMNAHRPNCRQLIFTEPCFICGVRNTNNSKRSGWLIGHIATHRQTNRAGINSVIYDKDVSQPPDSRSDEADGTERSRPASQTSDLRKDDADGTEGSRPASRSASRASLRETGRRKSSRLAVSESAPPTKESEPTTWEYDDDANIDVDHQLPGNVLIGVNSVTGIDDNKIVDGSEDEEEIEEWRCLSCNVKYFSELPFLLHVASHEVPYIDRCALCDGKFNNAADICMHMVKYHRNYLLTHQASDADLIPPPQETPAPTTKKLVKPKCKNVCVQADITAEITTTLKDFKSLPPSDSISNTDTKSEFSEGRDGQKYRSQTATYAMLKGTKCPVCKRSFASHTLLIKHYGIHDGMAAHVCLQCGIGYGRPGLYREHMTRCHKTRRAPKSNEEPCPKCGAILLSHLLNKHVQLCLNSKQEKIHQCFFCVKEFDSYFSFRSHLSTHNNSCSFCEQKFTTIMSWTMHMNKCPKNILLNKLKESEMPAYQKKMKAVGDEAVTKSPELGAKAKSSSKGEDEKENEQNVKHCEHCSYVSKGLYASSNLLKHLARKHRGVAFRCRLCSGTFSSLLQKNRHMLREHGNNSDKKEPAQPDVDTLTYFACNECHQCFQAKSELESHKKSEHQNPPAPHVKLFSCNICDKQFPSKFARRRHVQTAHIDPPKAVVSCNAKKSLSVECNLCNKRFQSNFARLQHLKRTHGNEDKLEDKKEADTSLSPPQAKRRKKCCPHCEQVFYHKTDYRSHMKSVHGTGQKSRSSIDHMDSIIIIDQDEPGTSTPLPKSSSANLLAAPICEAESDTHAKRSSSPQVEGDKVKMELSTIETKPMKIRQCSHCDRLFDNKAELKAHKRQHKQENKEKEQSSQTVVANKRSLPNGYPVKPEVDAWVSSQSEFVPKTVDNKQTNPVANGGAAAAGIFCEICNKNFKLTIQLKHHMSKAH